MTITIEHGKSRTESEKTSPEVKITVKGMCCKDEAKAAEKELLKVKGVIPTTAKTVSNICNA